jgi:ASPIC and UnbV
MTGLGVQPSHDDRPPPRSRGVDEFPACLASPPHRSANASRTASAPKAAAKVRRSQASTRGRSRTWRRVGAALADFNLDGAIDLLVVDRNAPARLWRNDTPEIGHWTEIKAEQDGVNRDAIGGWIEVRCGDRVQRRELTIGGGHAGGPLTWTHFGLGDAETAEVSIIWPDGQADDWRPAAGDAFYLVRRGGSLERWTPKPPQG